MSEQKTTPIVFNGKASEYFGIWIVNLLLTLITLGIYSAWAKVRRKKYFYNNTLIENVSFDYHARPIAILKGRIIAAVFFMLYSASGGISPILSLILGLVLFVAIPWIVVRGLLFNARNTSHRGLRFDFVGTVAQARKVFILLPMLIFFTLGLIWPYIAHQRKRFIMSHHRFGLTQFDMQAVVGKFYKVYLVLFVVPIIGIIAAVAIPAYVAYTHKAKAANHAEINAPYVMGFVDVQPSKNLQLAANEPPKSLTKVEQVYSDNGTAAPSVAQQPNIQSTVQPEKVYSEASGASPADGGSEMANEATQPEVPKPEAAPVEPPHEKTFEERMKERQEARAKAMQNILTHPQMLLYFLIGAFVYLIAAFGFIGYLQARVSNLVWNNTTLGELSFSSTLRARDFIWLYFTNIIAIVCTFGLATPWAQIRLARYRASKLAIVGNVNFDQFVGEKLAEMKATGEEIADFFDVDLTFG